MSNKLLAKRKHKSKKIKEDVPVDEEKDDMAALLAIRSRVKKKRRTNLEDLMNWEEELKEEQKEEETPEKPPATATTANPDDELEKFMSNIDKEVGRLEEQVEVEKPANPPQTISLEELLATANQDEESGEDNKEGDNQEGENEETDETFHKQFMEEMRKKVEEEKKRIKEQELNELQQEVEQERQEELLMRKDAGKATEENFFATNVPRRKQKKDLMEVDHNKRKYAPFRKRFYIPVPEIKNMTNSQIERFRKENEEIKVKGKDCPNPINSFLQCGLPDKVLEVIQKQGYEKPFPIQCQAIPIIMSGRDCIGIAKTGSGKTLAFVLPLIRHVLDQPPLVEYDGPIGLVMAPTRELAVQIYQEVKRFGKVVNLTCACVYGGANISDQIAELRRGCEIVVCTPGRMIDMLTANAGRVTNLHRVTFVVLDEADRMFDLGFAPQIMLMLNNVRPDRQTVMFSATFPKMVEHLARKAMSEKPCLVEVGGRTTVSDTITQLVEVVPEDGKFNRVLELLKDYYHQTLTLIFVGTQDLCDEIFRDLMIATYPSLSLNGAMMQDDRTDTIHDFKTGKKRILVATSLCARGLDVADLGLVINYTVPSHMEDYVHRVGRTGRAKREGTAITFITPDQDKFAPMLVEAVERSKQKVPGALQALAKAFEFKKKQGLISAEEARLPSGTTGKGHTFDEDDEKKKEKKKRQEMASWGEDVSDDEEEVKKKERESTKAGEVSVAGVGASTTPASSLPMATVTPTPAELAAAAALAITTKHNLNTAAVAAAAAALGGAAPQQTYIAPKSFQEELEINDYPQKARWKVTKRGAMSELLERYHVTITTRGVHVAPGKTCRPGERKLYLYIDGTNEFEVKQAKRELQSSLDEAALGANSSSGKYSVL